MMLLIKSYERLKCEKLGKNHVPTFPVFAGTITNYDIFFACITH